MNAKLIFLAAIGTIIMQRVALADVMCATYDAPVSITGRIFERTDYGPPNYGEDPKHDSKEGHLYIRLDDPLCVQHGHEADENGQSNISLMQMVYFVHLPFQKSWLNKHVLVKGMLMPQQTGHHHTPVLIVPDETHILEKSK